ncbi:MAG: hypothetical protein EZS28_010459, partial [Streblomastix strix]
VPVHGMVPGSDMVKCYTKLTILMH